jgi:TRAP-type C4-dicarboxylate transport system substrate-binding protein
MLNWIRGQRFGFCFAAGMAGFLATVPTHAESAQVVWKMNSTFAENRPETKFAEKLSDYVLKASNGRFQIKVYPGGSLGVKDPDTLRWLPNGNPVQMTWLYPEYMGRDLPSYANILPVGVLNDVKSLPSIEPVLKDIETDTYSKRGIKLLGWGYIPVKQMQIICKEPVRTLAELTSKKVRVFAKFHVNVFKALGVSAQVIPQSDLYVALQTGVVDCAFYPIAFAASASLQEVAPYSSYIGTDIPAPANIIAAKSAFDKLPKDLQDILVNQTARIEKETWGYLQEGGYDTSGEQKFKENGGKVIAAFSQEDQKKLVDECLKEWESVTKSTGEEAHDNYKKVRDKLGY